MVEAYVLISTEPARTAQIKSEILRIEGVKRADIVTGPADIVVLLEADNMSELRDMVSERIRGIEGILKTETMVVL